MKRTLLKWVCCPACGGDVALDAVASAHTQEIESGGLRCGACAAAYPIVNGIPRFLPMARQTSSSSSAEQARHRTQRSFGFQWTRFAGMHPVFEADFLKYVSPLTPESFRHRLVLDAGCGFGRHLFYAATYGAEAIGVDLSAAVESAHRNTAHLPGAHVIQADLNHLPFRPGTFDLVYSIGVLHHVPTPEATFGNLLRSLKPGGTVAIWVYSSTRRGINAMLEAARRLTTRLPLRLLLGLSWFAGLMDWACFIGPYRLASRWSLTASLVERIAWPRIKLYAAYPFEVCVADWLDRLSAPIRFYYNEEQLSHWCCRHVLEDVRISPTGRYGWRVCAVRSHAPA
ncbi:MAG: methyltransferase domain-containing protein [Candidatus Omnitrophica bacterium]|nr:methyltransferase domain-containing protein [Candidatus Omnitrophota bacterium]